MTLNISSNNVYGQCDLKCAYSFSYSNSSCIVKNEGFSLSISYDSTNTPPVTYNNNKYLVHEVILFSPSIHLFNNVSTDAELVIYHYPVSGGQPLYVSIPIVQSDSVSEATTILTNIVETCASLAPSQGTSATVNIQNYSLQPIVPSQKPFYSYTDSSGNNWVVFGKEMSLSLSKNTLDTVKQLIQPLNYVYCVEGPSVFYNEKGANTTDTQGSDIYIDCQPVSTSEETTITQQQQQQQDSSSSNFFKNSQVKYSFFIILFLLAFLLFFVGIYYFIVGKKIQIINK